jgi:hypothetical protein
MKVFLSWSGERSQALALALREWLGLVLHYVEPWASQSDIDAGERWANKIAKELEASTFGIIAITRENIGSPWILFEAGALARSMEEGRVIPLLLDLDFKEITGPIAQFQAKKVEQSGIREVVESINKLASQPVPDARLAELLEMAWPRLEKSVSEIPKNTQVAKHNRPQAEILEELVASVRGLDVRYREMWDDPRPRFRRRLHPAMLDEMMHMNGARRGDPMRILVAVSFLRDDFPWIYELGMEVFRAINAGDRQAAQRCRSQLMNALRSLRHGPMMDFMPKRDMFEAVHFATMILEEDSLELEMKSRAKKRPPGKARTVAPAQPPRSLEAGPDSDSAASPDTE